MASLVSTRDYTGGCDHGGDLQAFTWRCHVGVRGDGYVVCGHALLPLPCVPVAARADYQRALHSSVCVLDCGLHSGLWNLLLASSCKNFLYLFGKA